ncbi:Uncharacterised protein [Klebsiella pneumoniae]|nr:Uncharacterised protein [Klebsiella pneumoniae]
MPGVNILCIGLGFTQITPEIEADTVRQRTIEAKVSTFRRPFFTVLRSIHIGIPRTVPFWCGRFGHDVNDPAHRAITIARRRRAADHIDMIDHLRWHPTGIAAGVTIAAPAIPHRVTAGHRFTIDQHQRILRPHATDINLPVVAALPAGRVAGQVYPGLRTNELRHIAGGGMFADLFCGDGRHARRLQVLPGGGYDHRLLVIFGSGGALVRRRLFGHVLCRLQRHATGEQRNDDPQREVRRLFHRICPVFCCCRA